MPGWTLRTADGDSGPLTIYQLQHKLHAGQVRADDLLRLDDGAFQRVADVPALAKLLKAPEPDPAQPGEPDDVVVVNGVKLKRGADGKPLPPTPAELAQMLRTAEPRKDLVRTRRWVLFFAALIAIAGGIFATVIVKMMTGTTGTSVLP